VRHPPRLRSRSETAGQGRCRPERPERGCLLCHRPFVDCERSGVLTGSRGPAPLQDRQVLRRPGSVRDASQARPIVWTGTIACPGAQVTVAGVGLFGRSASAMVARELRKSQCRRRGSCPLTPLPGTRKGGRRRRRHDEDDFKAVKEESVGATCSPQSTP